MAAAEEGLRATLNRVHVTPQPKKITTGAESGMLGTSHCNILQPNVVVITLQRPSARKETTGQIT